MKVQQSLLDLVEISTRMAVATARLRVQRKYILDVVIYMITRYTCKQVYVVNIGVRESGRSVGAFKEAPEQTYRMVDPKTNRTLRGKYRVRGARRKLGGRVRRVLTVTSEVTLGRENYRPQRGGENSGAYTRLLSLESSRHGRGGGVSDNPGAPVERPAGPGLPAGGDAADYDY